MGGLNSSKKEVMRQPEIIQQIKDLKAEMQLGFKDQIHHNEKLLRLYMLIDLLEVQKDALSPELLRQIGRNSKKVY